MSAIKTFLFCARKIEIYWHDHPVRRYRGLYIDIGRYLKPGTYRSGSMVVEMDPMWVGFSYRLWFGKAGR